MSQFTRTATQVDGLEKQLNEYNGLNEGDTALEQRKEQGDSINSLISELTPSIDKFVAKAQAGEKDPNKRIYGASMVTKIFALRDRFSKITSDFTPSYEQLNEKWNIHQQQKQKEQEQEEQRKQEEQLKIEEQQRIEDERLEKERLLKQEEEEKLRSENEKKIKEEEIKKQNEIKLKQQQDEEKRLIEEKQNQEQLKKEEELKLKQNKEQERTKKEINLNDSQSDSDNITINIKTTHGITHTLNDVSLTQTVANLKEMIQSKLGVNKIAQRLIFQGRLLADNNPINVYKIANGSAIHMVENTKLSSASSSTTKKEEKLIVPSGTICQLQNGKDEYDEILSQCAKLNRLVVTDWYAPWCGPCRMISPVFERLSQRFTDVTFIKVDTEISSSNSQLAQEYQISAYPTFHFIISNVVKHSFSGANATNIESNIKKYRAMVLATSSNSNNQSVSNTLGPIGKKVMSSLTVLNKNLSMTDFIIAVKTLLKFVKNIVENPSNEKFRKVRIGNTTFQSRLGSKQGGMECMKSFGFEDVVENNEHFLVISASNAQDPELRTVMAQLQNAVNAAESSNNNGSSSSSNPTPAPNPVGGGFGGFGAGAGAGNLPDPATLAGMFGGAGGAGGPGMNGQAEVMDQLMQDPSFHQIAREMMNDPDAMSVIMQAQQAFANGDMATVQRLQGHPAMLRMHQAMTSNPAFLSLMMRQVAQQGFPGMGGAGAGVGGMPGMGTGMRTGNQAATPSTTGQQQQPQQPRGTGNNNDNVPMPPAYPGAPSSAEEEERLLQEAIRLSMQDQQQSPKPEDKTKDGNDANDKST